MLKKKLIIGLILILIVVLAIFFTIDNSAELKSITSERQLEEIYKGESSTINSKLINILTMPFSTMRIRNYSTTLDSFDSMTEVTKSISVPNAIPTAANSASSEGSSKDYSTTNIQVENVDEADITKTDGDYIYSISENSVVITDVKNPTDIKISATITAKGETVPEDLILYNDKLVVIYAKNIRSYSELNTLVNVYDITNREKPNLLKSYELYEPYYTSRCIDNELYVIASGNLRKSNNKIVRSYAEDSKVKEIALGDIKYLKDVKTRTQTLISSLDLKNAEDSLKVNSYLIDISNAYVSENSIYLLDQNYEYNRFKPNLLKLWGLKGVFGLFDYDYDYYNYDSGYKTEIYKFGISKDGNVNYLAKNKIEGKTINQYSLDEDNGHLRMALFDNDGARIAVFDEHLKQIGISEYVAKGEKMYSSRFMGEKAYLVTYQTIDPLFVFDLSDETNPVVLGELHIPGYSTYLHPYDNEHLIGIGMQTEEIVNRDSYGKVRSVTAKITGMKMALFDVSDVNHPIQISETIIGDSRTTSAILTNPKALLFSKERELIAIPVNNYSEEFQINDAEDYSSIESLYRSRSKDYISEGYLVYNINLKDGFKLKGIVTHEKKRNNTPYSYYYNSKMLRWLYIDENLYTVSEDAIKVNKLNTLEQVSELKLKR